jgi:hypothetical protein
LWQEFTFATELNAQHRTAMPDQFLPHLPSPFPKLHGTISTSRRDVNAIRADTYCGNLFLIGDNRLLNFSSERIPKPHPVISATRDHRSAVAADGNIETDALDPVSRCRQSRCMM